MITVKSEFSLLNFLHFMNDAQGCEEFEKIVTQYKLNLIQKLCFECLKDYDSFYKIRFRKEYWSDEKIEHLIRRDCLAIMEDYTVKYKSPCGEGFISFEEMYKLVKERKPFDLVLELAENEMQILELIKYSMVDKNWSTGKSYNTIRFSVEIKIPKPEYRDEIYYQVFNWVFGEEEK